MGFIAKLSRAYREGGVFRLAKAVYVRARPLLSWLPRETVLYAGIKVRSRFWLDRVFALDTDLPLYEHALVAGLDANVRPGDHVVVVGCGEGVTAAFAAGRAGPNGTIVGYEGSRHQVETTTRTLSLNGVTNATIHHAVVGSAIGVYGNEAEFGTIIRPEALPECDVLEMDCEGAEVQILKAMLIRPRVILVETHGVHGAATSLVAALLIELGYKVNDLGWAEPYLLSECTSNDIRVLEGLSVAV
jgi:hypothetical protein